MKNTGYWNACLLFIRDSILHTYHINFHIRMSHVAKNASRLHSFQILLSKNAFIACQQIRFTLSTINQILSMRNN